MQKIKTKHWSQKNSYNTSHLLDAALQYLSIELYKYIMHDNIDNPFDNSGTEFKNEIFEVISYDWREDYDKGIIQPYNFKWRDFEVKWYKYLGRGMECNREISNDEIDVMLNECLKSIDD